MNSMRVFFIALTFFSIFPRYALARAPEAETDLKFGIGAFNSAKDSVAEVKSLELGYTSDLAFGLRQRIEVQGWIDSRGDLDRKIGGMGAYLLGIDVNPGVFYSSMYMGAGLLYPHDSLLGGAFQFTEEFEFGLRDDQQHAMGFCYKHISSAGLESPNIGRDFVMIKMGIPF